MFHTQKIQKTNKMNKQNTINKIMDNITTDENLCIVRQALEQNLKYCCDEEMNYLGFIENPLNEMDSEVWVCGICGEVRTESTLKYDDEELYNLLSNNLAVMEKTQSWNKLKKEFEE